MDRVLHILLIEDNPADARLVDLYLSDSTSFKFELETAGSLGSGIKSFSEQAKDIVLLDLSLPDSFGLDTPKQFLNKFPEASVIVLTGFDDITMGVNAVGAGAIDYLVKDEINTNVLAKTILYALERKRNQDLIKAKEIAEKSNQLKQKFLAHMSHELRTPLNVVIGMTQLFENSDLNDEQSEYLRALKLSSNNLLQVINNILDFSKIESGRLKLEKAPFHLKDLLRDLITTYKFKTSNKGIGFLTDFSENLPRTIIGDSVRLNQVLINLMDNACKYTSEGSITLATELMNEDGVAAMIKFSVRDTGIGIEAEKLDQIFESFTQANDSTTRLYGGTGLGLTIANELVLEHGGEMNVESEVGKGTTFSFTINFNKDLTAKRSIETQEETLPELKNDREYHLLLVEDNDLNQLVAGKTLRKWSEKIKLDVANNGKEAVDLASKKVYDVILMDISMPIMDGHDATLFIRNELSPPLSEVPILAMTAHAIKSEIERCYNVGMNGFISKPIDKLTLFKRLKKLLDSGLPVREPIIESFDAAQIDITYLEELSEGDEGLRNNLIANIIEDFPKDIDKLRVSFDIEETAQFYSITHKLRTTFAYIGLRKNNLASIIIDDREDKSKLYCTEGEMNDFQRLCAEVLRQLGQLLEQTEADV